MATDRGQIYAITLENTASKSHQLEKIAVRQVCSNDGLMP